MIRYNKTWNDFITRNYHELKKFFNAMSKSDSEDNFHSWLIEIKERDILNKFDEDKGNFLSYLRLTIKSYMGNFRKLKDNKIIKQEFNDDVSCSGYLLPGENIDRLDFNDSKLNYIANELRKGDTSSEIARSLNLSKQRVEQLRKKMKFFAQKIINDIY